MKPSFSQKSLHVGVRYRGCPTRSARVHAIRARLGLLSPAMTVGVAKVRQATLHSANGKAGRHDEQDHSGPIDKVRRASPRLRPSALYPRTLSLREGERRAPRRRRCECRLTGTQRSPAAMAMRYGRNGMLHLVDALGDLLRGHHRSETFLCVHRGVESDANAQANPAAGSNCGRG